MQYTMLLGSAMTTTESHLCSQPMHTFTAQSSEQVILYAHSCPVSDFSSCTCDSAVNDDMSKPQLARGMRANLQLFLLTTDQNNQTKDPAQT